MSIAVGVYDLFSYTMPGIFYLFIINEFLKLFDLPNLDFTNLKEPVIAALIILLAYITGQLLDTFADKWRGLREKKKGTELAIEKLKRDHPDMDIQFKRHDWSMLFAVVRKYHDEAVAAIDKNKAISILFQNLSLGFLLYTILQIITMLKNGVSIGSLLLAIVAIFLCHMARERSKMFNLWFYGLVFQMAFTYGANASDIIKKSQGVHVENNNKTSPK